MAADLAKLSLWLATLARDHPFTFLDHAIRAGDSLVGLTRRQIEDFHWRPERNPTFSQEIIGQRLKAATAVRREILAAGDDLRACEKSSLLTRLVKEGHFVLEGRTAMANPDQLSLLTAEPETIAAEGPPLSPLCHSLMRVLMPNRNQLELRAFELDALLPTSGKRRSAGRWPACRNWKTSTCGRASRLRRRVPPPPTTRPR